VAEHVVLGQVEAVVQDREEPVQGARRVRGDQREAGAEVVDRLVEDDVQAVLLGLEVVVERGRPEPDVSGDVGPLRLLVAVAAEALGRRLDDVRPPGGAHLATAERSTICLTTSRLTTFSDGVRGKSSNSSTDSGHVYLATPSASKKRCSSSSVGADSPGSGTIAAHARSPSRSSGSGTTATSCT